MFGPAAPIDFILSTYTLGVFDACGGHANPHEGYHYHAAVGCSEIGDELDGHPSLIGYALDGYGIYSRHEDTDLANNLDECGGETDDVRGYHYHASAPGNNEIIGCYRGEQALLITSQFFQLVLPVTEVLFLIRSGDVMATSHRFNRHSIG